MDPVILAADDDEDAQFLLRRAFGQAGIKAVLKQVNDGREAIEYLDGRGRFNDRAEFPIPKLLLLDLKMPQVSGFGVLEHLNKAFTTREFIVAVFSSSDNPQDVQRAHALGCDAFLVKPTDFKGLVSLVRSMERDLLTRTPGQKAGPRPMEESPLSRRAET